MTDQSLGKSAIQPSSHPAIKPIILAFDTATDYLTAAVGGQDNILASRHFLARRDHMAKLLPAIDDILKETGIILAQIDRLAVGVGPGSFTGVRIGVATAQGLAHGTGKQLIGVSTLDILAEPILAENTTALICPIMDAKRGEVYTAFYQNGKRLTDYSLLFPEDLVKLLSEQIQEVVVTGDGLMKYQTMLVEKLGKRIKIEPEDRWFPRAGNMIKLALKQRGKPVSPYYRVLPIYIRLSDAEEGLKRQKQS